MSPVAMPASGESPVPRYTYTGPVDHTIPVDKSQLVGKSVIITGGANGMGEVAARRFVADGAFVTIGDLDIARGKAIEDEFNLKGSPAKVRFVECNIKVWDDQVRLFEAATADGRGLDVVIANAGISRSSGDSLWQLDGEQPRNTLVDVDWFLLLLMREPEAKTPMGHQSSQISTL